MKVAYFDCFAGISGDMILGALIDAGLDIENLKIELSKLGVDGWRISSEKVVKNGISGTKVKVITEEQHAHRHLKNIVQIIDDSSLDDTIKNDSKAIFERLAEVEAKIHNTTPDKIHFHEVGALDAIIDIVGAVAGITLLGIEKIYSSKIHVGTGFVDCAHGKIPLPAPATVELLKGIPIYSTGIENELTTPTGAAIISSLAEQFGANPSFQILSTGYGAGSRDLNIPNMLRLMIGEIVENGFDSDVATLIETNIDDMNPEFFDYVIERVFKAGALDAYITPIFMKKNRPGSMLSVLCPSDKQDNILEIIFTETTTLGVRIQRVERKKLQREIKTAKTKYGDIRVKIGFLDNRVKSIMPEYDDCKTIAEKLNIPIREIYEEARTSAENTLKD